MWVCSPNHGELLGLAARGATRDDAPLLASTTGLPPAAFAALNWKIGLGAWREMTGEGGSARAPQPPGPRLRRVLERDPAPLPSQEQDAQLE